MFEKRLAAVPPQSFIANGTVEGEIQVDDASLFKVKQQVVITATSLPNLELEVKRVIDINTLYVGPKTGNIDTRTDVSAYTLLLNAAIFANEQQRPKIPEQEIERHTYEEEPVVARRVVMVDKLGNKYGPDNPLPIAFDGTIAVGNVTIQDDDGDELAINSDGSINVSIVESEDSPGLDILYNEISSVASGVETTIITTVVSVPSYRVSRIEVSGSNVAQYRVKVNGVTKVTKRSYWTDFNQTFDFPSYINGLKLEIGDVLTVTVIHGRPMLGSFEATIMAK